MTGRFQPNLVDLFKWNYRDVESINKYSSLVDSMRAIKRRKFKKGGTPRELKFEI